MDNNENIKMLKNLTALYVEDDELSRTAIKEFLNEIFKEVDDVSNAPDAFDLFEKKRHDVVITDIELGEMNGFELARAIRNISPQAPIIILSAYSSKENIDIAKELHISEFLTKPVEYEKLLQAIQNSIQQSASFNEFGEGKEFVNFLLDENPRFAIEFTKNKISYINRTLLYFIGFDAFSEYEKSGVNFGTFLRTKDGNKYEEYAMQNWFYFIGKNGSEIYITDKNGKICKFFAYSREFFGDNKKVIFFDQIKS